MTTSTNLNSVSFSDCPISRMMVDMSERLFTISFDFIYIQVISGNWETVDEATLAIANWESIAVSKYADDNWMMIDLSKNPEDFKEVLDIKHLEDLLTIEGFSAQSGDWLKYEFKGTYLQASVKIQED